MFQNSKLSQMSISHTTPSTEFVQTPTGPIQGQLTLFLPTSVPGASLGPSSSAQRVQLTSVNCSMGGLAIKGGNSPSACVPFSSTDLNTTNSAAYWLTAFCDDTYLKMNEVLVSVSGGTAYAQAVGAGYVLNRACTTASLTSSDVNQAWQMRNKYPVATSYLAQGYGVAALSYVIV